MHLRNREPCYVQKGIFLRGKIEILDGNSIFTSL